MKTTSEFDVEIKTVDGTWGGLDTFDTLKEARAYVAENKKDDQIAFDRETYRIVKVTREVVK